MCRLNSFEYEPNRCYHLSGEPKTWPWKWENSALEMGESPLQRLVSFALHAIIAHESQIQLCSELNIEKFY